MRFLKIKSFTLSTPLLFQSKILCLSLLYLVTTLSLSVYVSFSQSGCLFQSPPFPPNSKLFNYPKSYGEHKYALPTARTSCSSPVFFPGAKFFAQFFADLSEFRSKFASLPMNSWLCRQITILQSRRFMISATILQGLLPLLWGTWREKETVLQGTFRRRRGSHISIMETMIRWRSLVGSLGNYLSENLVLLSSSICL